MVVAGADCGGTAAQPRHLDGCQVSIFGSNAQCAKLILSPALDAAVGCQCAGMLITCADSSHATTKATDVHGNTAGVGAAIPQLTIPIAPAAHGATIGHQRAEMCPNAFTNCSYTTC